ncbi:PQQ-binding-like beta-propeller repeat protein [Haloplanus sp. C73]|uniref:outer membrane protein assembly factor BamB family protein n=1 Tax=Haloplanus sp. C73 TaxID=3421641 RepID=UPI003EB8947A
MPSITRRTLLGTLAAGVGAGVAGCSSSCPDSDDPTPTTVFGTGDATGGFDSLPGGSWPSPRFDAGNTGHAPSRRPPESPSLRWRTTLSAPRADGAAVSAPVVDADTVYLATSAGAVALALGDGSVRWRTDSISPTTMASTVGVDELVPPVVADGRVYLAASSGLVALDAADGETVWRYDSSPTGVPAVHGSGLFVPLEERLAHLDGDGAERWTADVDASHPAVADGRVVASGREETVALDAATGERRWSASVDAETHPVVADGTVYLGAYGGVTALVLDDGSERWHVDRGGGRHFSAPVVTPETVYAVERPVEVGDATFALDRAADPPEPRWCSYVGEGTVAAAAGDHVFTLQGSGTGATPVRLVSFTTRFGEATWGYAARDRVLPPAILDGGGVVATRRGTVVGFGGD